MNQARVLRLIGYLPQNIFHQSRNFVKTVTLQEKLANNLPSDVSIPAELGYSLSEQMNLGRNRNDIKV
jgi:hypothetical protein